MMFNFSFPQIEYVWVVTRSAMSHENEWLSKSGKEGQETEELGISWGNVVLQTQPIQVSITVKWEVHVR